MMFVRSAQCFVFGALVLAGCANSPAVHGSAGALRGAELSFGDDCQVGVPEERACQRDVGFGEYPIDGPAGPVVIEP